MIAVGWREAAWTKISGKLATTADASIFNTSENFCQSSLSAANA